MNELVSICMPCYNQGQFLREALDSALNQTYPNIEIICVNDGSTDDTADILKEYEEKHNSIKVFHNEENKGAVYTKNLSVEKANGIYILPFDSDDVLHPAYVEKAIKIFNENPDIGIVYCRQEIIGNAEKAWELDDFDPSNILYRNCLLNSSLYRKSDFIKIGGYNPNMKIGLIDWNFWLSFIEMGIKPYRIDEVLFSYRIHDFGRITDNVKKNPNEARKQLILNHINLYLNDPQFYKRLFAFSPKQIETLKNIIENKNEIIRNNAKKAEQDRIHYSEIAKNDRIKLNNVIETLKANREKNQKAYDEKISALNLNIDEAVKQLDYEKSQHKKYKKLTNLLLILFIISIISIIILLVF